MQEISFDERKFLIEELAEHAQLKINDRAHNIDIQKIDDHRYSLLVDHRSYVIERMKGEEGKVKLAVNGRVIHATVKGETDLMLERLGMNIQAKKDVKELKAPMPGLVIDFKVQPGQEVAEGDALVVLEAMKMENVLKSPAAGVIKNIHVEKGQAIEKNTLIISFE